MLKGIDVSVWQGSIDWSKAKKEIDFAILRAGYGKEVFQKDDRFEEYYAGCKANGIPVGAYWFSYATTAAEAVQEARACIECIKGKSFEYPILFDVEHQSQCSKSVASAIIPAFCKTMREAGYYVGLYTYYSFIMSYIPEAVWKEYDIAIAHYASSTPWTGNKTFWQFTEKGTVAGINGTVDRDYCYVDNYPEKIKALGLNNLGKKEAVMETKKETTDYIVDLSKPIPENKVTTLPYNSNIQISKHFNAHEFKCKCGKAHDIKLNYRLIWLLEKIMEQMNGSMTIINSGYRCPTHDKNVGGSGTGQHVYGNAVDAVFYDQNKRVISTKKLSCVAQDLGLGGIANITGSYTAIHLDVRTGYRWLGNEVVNNNTVTSDFYKYYGLTKDQVYPKKVAVQPVEEKKEESKPVVKEEPKKEEVKPVEPVKKEEKIESITVTSAKAGTKVELKDTMTYSSSSTKSGNKKSGTYYVYSNEVLNGRVRMTNSVSNVGKTPVGSYVSFWIDVTGVEEKKETVIEKKQFKAGDKVALNNTALYASASSSKVSSNKSGTYWIYSDTITNGRIRITNSTSNVGKTPAGQYVTGYVNVSDIK